MAGDQQTDDEQALALLVPFYVNGALPADARAKVEAALPGDAALRAELEAAREIAALVKQGGAELAAETAAAPSRLLMLLSRLEMRRTFWKPAFAAAAAVVAMQAGVILWQATRDGRYEGLSGPVAAAPERAGQLLVRLSPDARWAEVEALLSSRGLEIVGGPSGDDLKVAVGAGAQVDEAVRWLRASPLVEFAGPAS